MALHPDSYDPDIDDDTDAPDAPDAPDEPDDAPAEARTHRSPFPGRPRDTNFDDVRVPPARRLPERL